MNPRPKPETIPKVRRTRVRATEEQAGGVEGEPIYLNSSGPVEIAMRSTLSEPPQEKKIHKRRALPSVPRGK